MSQASFTSRGRELTNSRKEGVEGKLCHMGVLDCEATVKREETPRSEAIKFQ